LSLTEEDIKIVAKVHKVQRADVCMIPTGGPMLGLRGKGHQGHISVWSWRKPRSQSKCRVLWVESRVQVADIWMFPTKEDRTKAKAKLCVVQGLDEGNAMSC
jgi:hypothetical protein